MNARGRRLARLHLVRTIRVREAGWQLAAAVAAAAAQEAMLQRIAEVRDTLAAGTGSTQGSALNAQAALRAGLLTAATRQVARQVEASERLAIARLSVREKQQLADAVERAIGRERGAALPDNSAADVSVVAKARRT